MNEFTTARPSGMSAFRFTLEGTQIRQSIDQIPDAIDPDQPVTLTMVIGLDGTQRTMAIYPCRDFELLNFVCIVQDKHLHNATTESWTANGDKQEMLELFNDFPPWTLALLRYISSIKHTIFTLTARMTGWQRTSSCGNYGIKTLCRHMSEDEVS
jgi:salicylate hydroxylase